jgi:hypothetical protein
LGGYAVEIAGLVPALLVVGGLYLLTTVSLAFNQGLKGMDERVGVAGVETTG